MQHWWPRPTYDRPPCTSPHAAQSFTAAAAKLGQEQVRSSLLLPPVILHCNYFVTWSGCNLGEALVEMWYQWCHAPTVFKGHSVNNTKTRDVETNGFWGIIFDRKLHSFIHSLPVSFVILGWGAGGVANIYNIKSTWFNSLRYMFLFSSHEFTHLCDEYHKSPLLNKRQDFFFFLTSVSDFRRSTRHCRRCLRSCNSWAVRRAQWRRRSTPPSLSSRRCWMCVRVCCWWRWRWTTPLSTRSEQQITYSY